MPAPLRLPAGSVLTNSGNANSTTFDNYGAAAHHTLVTVTSAGISAGTVQLQGSADNTNWVNIGTAITLTASSTQTVSVANTPFQFLRAVVASIAGGTVSVWIMSAG